MTGRNTSCLVSEEQACSIHFCGKKFGKTEDAYDGFVPLLKRVIIQNNCKNILDVGGGAQPQLPLGDDVLRHRNYTVMDVSERELALASSGYRKIVMDIGGEVAVAGEEFDMVFSRFVAEHVADARRLHTNVFRMLKPGGVAIHFFPTLFALPFLVNKCLPEWLTVWFLSRERQQRGKFPAYYHWCVGPSKASIERLEMLGYEVLEYAGFFGHGYYDALPPLRFLHAAFRNVLLKQPISTLTSFAWIVLRKPNPPLLCKNNG